jgi:hypothetical protein
MKATRILMDGHRVIEPVSAPAIRETWLPHRRRMIQSWLALPSARPQVLDVTVVESSQAADRSPRPASATSLPHAAVAMTARSMAAPRRVLMTSLR